MSPSVGAMKPASSIRVVVLPNRPDRELSEFAASNYHVLDRRELPVHLGDIAKFDLRGSQAFLQGFILGKRGRILTSKITIDAPEQPDCVVNPMRRAGCGAGLLSAHSSKMPKGLSSSWYVF